MQLLVVCSLMGGVRYDGGTRASSADEVRSLQDSSTSVVYHWQVPSVRSLICTWYCLPSKVFRQHRICVDRLGGREVPTSYFERISHGAMPQGLSSTPSSPMLRLSGREARMDGCFMPCITYLWLWLYHL